MRGIPSPSIREAPRIFMTGLTYKAQKRSLHTCTCTYSSSLTDSAQIDVGGAHQSAKRGPYTPPSYPAACFHWPPPSVREADRAHVRGDGCFRGQASGTTQGQLGGTPRLPSTTMTLSEPLCG